jgi:hypothetical protein
VGAARGARNIDQLDAVNSRNSLIPTSAQAPIRAEIFGDDRCTAEGLTVRAAAPTLAMCRKLIAAGLDPNRPLDAFRAGMLCVRIRSIAEAAQFVVDERRMALARWKPVSRAEGSPRIASWQRAAISLHGAAP